MTKAEILREKCHTEKYTFSRQDPLLNNVLLHCIYIRIQIYVTKIIFNPRIIPLFKPNAIRSRFKN